MPVELIETAIFGSSAIRMRIADSERSDPQTATEWLEFLVAVAPLKHLDQAGPRQVKLSDDYLSVIQVAALRYAREMINREIRLLGGSP
jgi:hypothetical protein